MNVNFNAKTQSNAYSEGMKDGMAPLVDMLIEEINYLLEGIENNARPETVAKMNAFYAARNL